MKILIIIASLILASCAADEFLSRGENLLGSNGNSGFDAPTPEEYFEETLLPLLNRDCKGCHGGSPAKTYEEALTKVVLGNHAESILYKKATGQPHGGGATWATDSEEALALASWIDALE